MDLEKWRFERVKQVLRDYPEYDLKIAKIEESIRYPHKPDDYASDRRGTKTTPETATETLWTIQTHEAINQFRRNQKAVSDLLAECGIDTEVIIRELYMSKFPRYTMQGLVQEHKISCGKDKAFRLRNRFFEELDKAL